MADVSTLVESNTTLIVVGASIGALAVIVIGGSLFLKSFLRKVDQGFAMIVNKFAAEPKVTFTNAIVIPLFHRVEVMDISLKTIEVDRQGTNGLICADNIRADIKVAFFVRVNKTTEDVLKVAGAVGVARASDTGTLEVLFQAKFSEALKTVGKKMNFIDLYNERDQFKDQIMQVIGRDLNGYSLEDAAIDYLEQTPLKLLDPDNILDSEGRKKIIDLTTQQRVKANEIQREGEKVIKKQDVEAREALLALERQQAEAEAKQHREIATNRAREQSEEAKVQFEEHKRAEEARLGAEQEIGILRENS
ncbi:MAG TPA: SPFH domain-containing protein [Planctomycetota bacterium]|nr:SPFH domain-containing protein [Planctomycetota bacterium]